MKSRPKRATPKRLRFITENGKPVAVVLPLQHYRALMEHLEDLEDSLELEEAVRTATRFTRLEDFKREVAAIRERQA